MKKIFTTILTVAVLILESRAQSLTLYDSTNSGLPNAYINRIACDSTDNVWMATSEGLVKFDGSSFIVYDDSNSPIPSNFVLGDLTIDKKNNAIWCSGYNSSYYTKFFRYDGTNWIVLDTSSFPTNQTYLAIKPPVIDTNGIAYFGTNKGLFIYDYKTSGWTVLDTNNWKASLGNSVIVTVDPATNYKWLLFEYISPQHSGSYYYFYDGVTLDTVNYSPKCSAIAPISIIIDGLGGQCISCPWNTVAEYYTVATGNIDTIVVPNQYIESKSFTFDQNTNTTWFAPPWGYSGSASDSLYSFDAASKTFVQYPISLPSVPGTNNCLVRMDIDRKNNKWLALNFYNSFTGFRFIKLARFNESGIPASISDYKSSAEINVYPNPFSSVASINYTLKESVVVRLELCNVLGERAGIIFEGTQQAGTHVCMLPIDLPAGLYFVKLITTGGVITKQIIKIH